MAEPNNNNEEVDFQQVILFGTNNTRKLRGVESSKIIVRSKYQFAHFLY